MPGPDVPRRDGLLQSKSVYIYECILDSMTAESGSLGSCMVKISMDFGLLGGWGLRIEAGGVSGGDGGSRDGLVISSNCRSRFYTVI